MGRNENAPQEEMTMQEYQLQQQSDLFHKAHQKTAQKLASCELDLSLAHAQVDALQDQVRALVERLQEYEDVEAEDFEDDEPAVKSVPNRDQRRKKNRNQGKKR